jgi:hypothetical protein
MFRSIKRPEWFFIIHGSAENQAQHVCRLFVKFLGVYLPLAYELQVRICKIITIVGILLTLGKSIGP